MSLVAASSFVSWLVGHVVLAWVMRTDQVPLSQQGWWSNTALLVWTLAAGTLLVASLAFAPLRTLFVRQTLAHTQLAGILLITAGWMVLYRLLRKRWVAVSEIPV
jgi:Ca2+-transporting ATPase